MKHIKLILLLFVFISNLFANELNKPFFDLGHKDSVSSIAVSPNKKLIASASSGKSIKLWDIETHKELKTFDLDFDRVDFISFSIDSGQTLIIGDNTNTIKFIDIKNGKIVDTFYDKNYKKGLVSSDRKIIAINEYGGTIKLLDTTTKKLIKKLKRDTDEIEVFAISLDGTTLVTASEYSLITVWDIKSKKIVKTINLMQSTPYIKSIAIDPNKKTLLISGEAGIFKLFDIQSGKCSKSSHIKVILQQ
jgi:WD40 repeat protein